MGIFKSIIVLFVIITISVGIIQTKKEKELYSFKKDALYMKEAQEFERKQREMFEKYTKNLQKNKIVLN